MQEARIREAERRQRRRALIAIGAALLMMAGILVVYAFYQRAVVSEQEAHQQKDRAVALEQQAQMQKDHAVASDQQAQLEKKQAQLQEARAASTLARQATEGGDAMTGMIATLAVLKPERPYSNAAGAALLDAWLRNREKYDLLGHMGPVTSVALSPSGKRVVTGSSDKTARVWDLSGATPAATVLEGPSGRGHQRSVQPRRTARGDGVPGPDGAGVGPVGCAPPCRVGPGSFTPSRSQIRT